MSCKPKTCGSLKLKIRSVRFGLKINSQFSAGEQRRRYTYYDRELKLVFHASVVHTIGHEGKTSSRTQLGLSNTTCNDARSCNGTDTLHFDESISIGW